MVANTLKFMKLTIALLSVEVNSIWKQVLGLIKFCKLSAPLS